MSTYIIFGFLGLGGGTNNGSSLIGATATVTKEPTPTATVTRVTTHLPTATVTRED